MITPVILTRCIKKSADRGVAFTLLDAGFNRTRPTEDERELLRNDSDFGTANAVALDPVRDAEGRHFYHGYRQEQEDLSKLSPGWGAAGAALGGAALGGLLGHSMSTGAHADPLPAAAIGAGAGGLALGALGYFLSRKTRREAEAKRRHLMDPAFVHINDVVVRGPGDLPRGKMGKLRTAAVIRAVLRRAAEHTARQYAEVKGFHPVEGLVRG